MAQYTITSANAIVMLSVDVVFPTPQKLVGFAVDAGFDTETAEVAEVQLGIDGFAAAGWLPRVITQTYSLIAASPSFRMFEDWAAAQDTLREIYQANGTIELPAIKRKYSLRQGVMTRVSVMPNARRVLDARQFTIVWTGGVVGADTD